MIERKPWEYGSGVKNRDYLKVEDSFESLVQELSAALDGVDPSNVRFQMEPTDGKFHGSDPLLKRLGCTRASWVVPLDTTLLDKFFNGRMGIRAQYYLDPYYGHSMNRMLLSALRGRLVELALAKDTLAEEELVELSLMQPSAKAWISEKNLFGQKIIRASDLTLVDDELQNDWLDMARLVKQGRVGIGDYQLYSNAINGVCVPMADQLEVKGAWITDLDRYEYVTLDKRDRDCQLFMFGFT